MVILKSNYKFIGFEISHLKNKKYNAILKNKENHKLKKIPFGDKRYEQYEDKTNLQAYKKLNHYDKERRRLYKIRHNYHYKKSIQNKIYSPSYFSMKYLW